MDTGRLKRFATEARNILLSGVVQRLAALGFQSDGTATEKPELLGGGAVFMGEVQSEDFYHKWMSLYRRMQSHSFREVAEEAAYTWFNRLVAIRIMVKNELIPAVLEYESDEVRIPVIVTEARQGRMPQMDEADRQKLDALLLDDALTDEQFALLIVAYCHSNPIISKCFGKIADYTELLLPGNILKNDGFIDRLNADDYISDDDYRSPELIGWLYQFYISERKDEVFAKKGKFEADEIPAATQIFTPNWIVKYMVQNTVGRIYLDNNPYSDIKESMKYLVGGTASCGINNTTAPQGCGVSYLLDDIHDLKVADLACGSGHILNECFDLLYQIYIEEGYNRRRAVEDIFRYNLTGVDIDTRAKQLAMFALLLKACQKDRSFADGHVLPRVWDMPKAGLPLPADARLANEIEAINKTLADADTLGSIMKFNLSPAAREWVVSLGEENETAQLVLALTDKYAALVMNPPYMGSGNMNAVLSNYVKKNYEAGKADLFSVFMQVAEERLAKNGKYGMINMQSWMFLSSFEKLRTHLLETLQIDSMLHLGPRTFDELSGEVVQNTAFVVTKHTPYTTGTYFRLVDGKSCRDKERMFLAGENGYSHVSQQNFEKIPGCPIGYWVSEKIFSRFAGNLALSAVCKPTQGLATADNARFLRYWHEVNLEKIGFGCSSAEEALETRKKWFPHNKGGGYRKWYGNQDYIINWENDGEAVKHYNGAIIRNPTFYFKPAVSWSVISSTMLNFRYYPIGFIPNMCGMCCYTDDENIGLYILGLSNTNVASVMFDIMNPTLNLSNGVFAKLPYIASNVKEIDTIVSQNISISKSDWDAHETSWDFQENELVRLSKEVPHPCGTDIGTGRVLKPNKETGGKMSASQRCDADFVAWGNNVVRDNSVPQGCGTSYLDKKSWVDIRYNKLPHWFQEGKTQFVTFRLADSLPQTKLAELAAFKTEWLKEHPQPWDEKVKSEYSYLIGERIDEWLDAGYGGCALKDPEVRRIVTDAFLFFNEKRYILHALVVMPNHVHVLLTPAEGYEVITTIGNIKSFTATKINKLLGKSGDFWQRNSFDRMLRCADDFQAKMDYIIHNPDALSHDTYTLCIGGAASCGMNAMLDSASDNGSVPQGCGTSLADLMEAYKEHWTEQFLRLHANEEELNRQFIEIYGLEDELTPDVPPEEITILQQGEISIENGQIVWHNDVIVKQLISYAVGCMMGRYSLDRKGLILANQGDGQKEYEVLVPNSRFAIDDDGIIPLMSVNNELTDHITLRFKTWLSIAFGEENFMDNLNFVEHALDKRLEDYFLKDFWKDHKKMYQNRPIYWLFSSKKGAFQCIAYMHRMNAYTAEKVRTQYLLPHIEWLMSKQAEMQANAANLSARERKELDNIGKQIDECREYHDRLHVVADKQIAFDLDDGVLVNYGKFGDVLRSIK